jgi:phenylpyruvate tautomerase PptA (4-oxalocrotonate tautomerase family)
MPVIHIRSLPFQQEPDMGKVVEHIARSFSDSNEIGLKYVTVTWDFLPQNQYAYAGHTVEYQTRDSHPILVDLLIPDFHSEERIAGLMKSLAEIISATTSIPRTNIFIQSQRAHSGLVYDQGQVVHWK